MAVKINRGTVMMQMPVIPLVDTIFNLLIFFLVATRVAEAERELPFALPDASEAQAITAKPQEMIVNIDKDGRYFLRSESVTLPRLETILRAASIKTGGGVPIVIRADKRCQWENVVAVMNACKKNKIRDYRVTTRDPHGG